MNQRTSARAKRYEKIGRIVIPGELEIHADRGVIYFHCSDPKIAEELNAITLLRICNLPKPIPRAPIDITHMVGVDYRGEESSEE